MIYATIRVTDLETGGDKPANSDILEVGWCDVHAHALDLAGDPYDWRPSEEWHAMLAKPTRPIPPESSAVHHLIEEDFEGQRPIIEVIQYAIESCRYPFTELSTKGATTDAVTPIAYAAHQAEFEQSFLADTEFTLLPWICTRQCAMHAWPWAPGNFSNQALRYWLKPIGLDRHKAHPTHRAGPDAYVSAFHLCELLNEGHSIPKLIRWTKEPALLKRVPLGEHRGKIWEENTLDEGMLRWILKKNFDMNTMFTARYFLNKQGEALY